MYKCKKCDFEADSVSAIGNHSKWEHNRDKQYTKCSHCNEKFQLGTVKKHELGCMFNPTNYTECKECGCHNIKINKITSVQKAYNSINTIVCFSKKFKNIEKEIKFFLSLKMYNNKNVLIKNNNGKKIIKKLYSLISKNPYKFLSKQQLKENKNRAITDFISGMTDRYAINLYNNTK